MNDLHPEPQASEPGWLPIREVARLTGVNPVTLRAWERRYGLIVPLRTGKGHRLYNDEHVARIREILAWLNRGVAVGQIKHCWTRASRSSMRNTTPGASCVSRCSPPSSA